jgi:hypothetical protein
MAAPRDRIVTEGFDMAVDSVQAGIGVVPFSRSAPGRERPNAHGHAAIAEVVLEALEHVRPRRR